MKNTKKIVTLFLSLCMLANICSLSAHAEHVEPAMNERAVLSNGAIETMSAVEYENMLYSMDQELDSDGDGLVDVIELVYGSDPYNSDTDGDGVNDYVEFCVTLTDFLTPDGEIDSDNDGLTNAEEMLYNTNPIDPDTDGDGLSDYDEIMYYHTDPRAIDTDGDSILDGIEAELGLNPLSATSDGIVPDAETLVASDYFAQFVGKECLEFESEDIATLATVDDSDYDGIPNSRDTSPNNNLFGGTLKTNYAKSSVFYNMDYRLFFASNKNYEPKLAIVSSLLSANIYADNCLTITSGGSLSPSASNALPQWMTYHGMTNVMHYDLASDATDKHVSEMYVGRRQVTYNGATKNVICVVIRGTNGTLEEWSSNFDIGDTSKSYNGWTNKNNHLGFEVAASRLNQKLNDYISTYCSGMNNVLWITGHSRGAAIANILAAKRVDSGNTVFAYTFATPNTTTVSTTTAQAAKYKCIFNIINKEDFVTRLPLTQNWKFIRYGEDKIKSIAANYKVDWQSVTGKPTTEYCSNESAVTSAVTELANTAATRNLCYQYRSKSTLPLGYHEAWYGSASERNSGLNGQTSMYSSYMEGTYETDKTLYDATRLEPYGYKIDQQPVFFMQAMAATMAEDKEGISKTEFVLINVAPYLENSKAKIVALSAGKFVEHPHWVESYYILARNISG